MEQIVFEQVVGPVVKFLKGHIMKHLGYVTSSTKHVNKMTKRMEDLEKTSKDVENHKDRNNINKKEIPTGVPGWLTEVENVKKKVQSISKDGIGCLNMKMRYRAGRSAFEAKRRIDELIVENSGFIWTDALIPTGRVDSKPASSTTSTPLFSSSAGDGFKSRDIPFNNALKFLQQHDNKNQVLALCGMGGVGKTTMMEQLKTVAYDNKLFHWIVKVVIGRNPNMLSIQNDIALCLGGESLHEATRTARGESLCGKFKETLEGKKKILVILDDVWQKIELKDIGLTSPLAEGITLLLTSRDSYICTQIAADVRSVLQVVRVDVLDEVEANNFFSQFTGVSQEDDHDQYQIGCDIVKKCGFLPLAIKLIGTTLNSQENIFVWRNTLNRLKNNDIDDNVQEIINISYEYIKKDKECEDIFLLCGLFPEDSDIPVEDLTRHAWGLNLFKNVCTLREARDKANTCVCNLINANLLIVSDQVGCVKMHDLVLAFVLCRVSKGDLAWIINHHNASRLSSDEMSESCKRISLSCNGMSEFPVDFNCPDLSLIQLMHGDQSLKFPKDLYENMKNLKIIAYYEMQYPLLPRSLTNLKSLCLHECRLMLDCSFVGALANLEVLSFAHSGIRKLPSTIGSLRKLKLLDLTGCHDLHIDDGIFKNLKNLEELYMRVRYEKAIRFTRSNYEELKMLSSKLCALEVEFIKDIAQLKNMYFNKLEKFEISIGCLFKKGKYDEKYAFKNTLKLVTRSNDIRDCQISELFKKTEKLYLHVNDMIGLEDIISVHPYDQHSFCSLRDLQVYHCSELKYLFTIPVASGLRKLECLKISTCSVLEALVYNDGSEIKSDGEMIKFEELKFLSLKNLPKLASLFLVDTVVELPQLVALEVDKLPNFTSIYSDKNNISTLLNSQVKIAKLESLMICSMNKLEQIWACNSEEEVNTISLLRRIWVQECDSLVNLFPTNPKRLLDHLESLTVKECGSIEVIFNIDLGCVDEVKLLNSSSSLRSIEVFGSHNLREVWRIQGGKSSSSSSLLIGGFEAVESIKIEFCKRFGNLITPTNIKFDMKALVDINIFHCGKGPSEEGKPWNDEMEKLLSSLSSLSRRESNDNINDNSCTVAFPSNLTHTFHNLHNLFLLGYNDVEVVFEIEGSPSSRELLLPNLRDLHLVVMKSMRHVWKCSNWNNFLILQNQSPFCNLTTIKVSDCNKIKYLFSPLMAKLLLNLKTIDIEDCVSMEEVISNIDDEDEETTPCTTFFPHLHSLSFKGLENLKRIGGGGGGGDHASDTTSVTDVGKKFFQAGVVSWSLCQYSREIHIRDCDELPNVIPSYAVGQMQQLQLLEVHDCISLTEVFESQGIDDNNNCGDSSSTNIDEGKHGTDTRATTLVIPKLENVSVPQLSNLKKLVITNCDLLQHVFTFSTLGSLGKLEKLWIKNCQAIKMIMKEENRDHMKTSEVVVFPRLKSLKLFSLPILEGFFLGKNNFQWPFLEKVIISECPQIMVFTSGQSTAVKLKYIHIHESFHVVPWSLCQYSREIVIDQCESLTEVFVTQGINNSGGGVTRTDGTSLAIPRLENINVPRLFNLKKLVITSCILLHVFTFSTLESLRQLEELIIDECKEMKVIVKEEKEEQRKVMEFPRLKSLKLFHLPNLKGFFLGTNEFQWPLLENVTIINCPQMMVFTSGQSTTPELKYILTRLGTHTPERGLNTKAQLPSSESASLEQLPWSFHNLIELDMINNLDRAVKSIIPSNELLQLQKLEKIEVFTCDYVEEVFEVEAMEGSNSESQTVVQIPNLTKLQLMDLRRLKYIWKSNHNQRTVLKFPNLTTLFIHN